MQQYVKFMENVSKNNVLKIKIIKNLETIAILQVDTDVQHIV